MQQPVRIGVLALQGSFAEHVSILKRLEGVDAFEVRTKEELRKADGLIIPGGESTTMALIAERWGLIPELKQFSAEQRPVWGTCAGAIFLADKATGHLLLDRCLNKQYAHKRRIVLQCTHLTESTTAYVQQAYIFRGTPAGVKKGGQALLGGLDCTMHRNFFGAQIRSFVSNLKAPACMADFDSGAEHFPAVFIRFMDALYCLLRYDASMHLRMHAD